MPTSLSPTAHLVRHETSIHIARACTYAFPVLLDFFIRHGWLTPDNEPNYTKLAALLHTPLRLPTP